MNVLIVANYAKEHINKFHLGTIKRMKELGWNVDVACKADAAVPYCDHLFDLPLERNPFRWQSFGAIRKLRAIIRAGKYDIVHVHTFAGKLVGILAAREFRQAGLKVIYSAHGFQYYEGASWLNWCCLPLDKWLMQWVDLLIVINREDLATAKRFHFHGNHVLQSCGINLKKFQVPSTARDAIRAELGIAADAPVLVYVAELTKNKNQEMLLRMFKRVAVQYPKAHLLLVGPDHYHGKIQRQIEASGLGAMVHCLGWRPDIPAILKASDVAVASSIREGFGVNIVEYMASGLPVVAVDNRGHREIIEDGATGCLVPQNDDRQMADRVIKLLSDNKLRETIVEHATRQISKYSEEVAVSRIIDCYHCLN